MGQESFGRYEIIKELGRGSMGVVYKARDPMLKRFVAIKSMGDAARADADFVKRFFREAEATAGLNHPNIVAVYDIGETDSQPYIAIEYLEGDDLGTILDKGAFIPFERKLDIVIQLCEGLGHAHSRGVVHRDIKPSNVQLTPDGTVKIVDFGIAKLVSSNLTTTGQLMGTPSYMAPEQVAGQPVDSRSDLFGVGVMLFQLITGKRPFEGGDFRAVMFAIATQEHPALDSLLPGCCNELVEVVDKALAKDPEERFQTAEELKQALQELKRRLPQLCRHVHEEMGQLAQELQQRQQTFPQDPELHKFAAELLVPLPDSDPEETIYGHQVSLQEDYGYLLDRHALCRRQLQHLELAIEQSEELSTLARRTREAMGQENWEECLQSARKILELLPDSSEALKIQAHCQQQLEGSQPAGEAEAAAAEPLEAKPESSPQPETSDQAEPQPTPSGAPRIPPSDTEVQSLGSSGRFKRVLLWVTPSLVLLLLVWGALYWMVWDAAEGPVVIYQVKAGDTLEALASRFGLPLEELQANNPGLDPSSLLPGRMINLVGHPRDPGSLVLDLTPWATVQSIVRNEDGAEVLGGTANTPLAVNLPLGTYLIKATNPELDSSVEFTLEVQPGQTTREVRSMPGFDLQAELDGLFGAESGESR